jgi:hypothetical protein
MTSVRSRLQLGGLGGGRPVVARRGVVIAGELEQMRSRRGPLLCPEANAKGGTKPSVRQLHRAFDHRRR